MFCSPKSILGDKRVRATIASAVQPSPKRFSKPMNKKYLLVIALLAVAAVVKGQATAPATTPSQGDPSINANGVIGEVKAIDTGAMQMIVKTDAGSLISVSLGEKTVYMRLAPGEKTLTNATKITMADVSEGDRVWARGKLSDDRKTVPAAAVIVMSKADIAKKHEAERIEWRRRGILGVISALKPESNEITISTRTMAGTQAVIIPVSEKVELRRYAPASI